MRPAGEIRQALLQACESLAARSAAGCGPTLREMAAEARVGLEAARRTVENMTRYGVLVVPRTRRVPYRNRPVAEYVPAAMAAQASAANDAGMAQLLRAWG